MAFDEDGEEVFAELGRVVYAEGHLQQLYAGIGLPRCGKKIKLVMEEYGVLRERGMAVSQRLARRVERSALQDQDGGSRCGFCCVQLSTAQKR